MTIKKKTETERKNHLYILRENMKERPNFIYAFTLQIKSVRVSFYMCAKKCKSKIFSGFGGILQQRIC